MKLNVILKKKGLIGVIKNLVKDKIKCIKNLGELKCFN